VSDFFATLIARATTEADALRPRIAPRFAAPAHESLLPPEEERATTHAPVESSFAPDEQPRELRLAISERTQPPATPPREAATTHTTETATNDRAMSHPSPLVRERIETPAVEPQPFSAIQPQSIPSEPPRESSARMPTATRDARESSRGESDRRAPMSPPRATLTPRRAIETATTRKVERIETRAHESRLTRISKQRDAPETTQSPPAPTIQVTIGRIEVRAESAPSPRRAEPAAPRLTLDEYLRQRGGER
jgi:hypothetical protein